MNIGFFVRHFSERGTEVAIYDYARYNEEILKNKSYIICFTDDAQSKIGFPMMKFSYEKFNNRFQIIKINKIEDMKNIIKEYNLDFFYTLTHGGGDIYKFENKNIWQNCLTIKHCVFTISCNESDFYISISHHLNNVYSTNIPVIPHIVSLPDSSENLRTELGIPKDAIVFGRHGSTDDFNIPMALEAIKDYVKENENVYFLFLNTPVFYKHPRIIYLERNLDLLYKTKFINSCTAMIHARVMGETFG